MTSSSLSSNIGGTNYSKNVVTIYDVDSSFETGFALRISALVSISYSFLLTLFFARHYLIQFQRTRNTVSLYSFCGMLCHNFQAITFVIVISFRLVQSGEISLSRHPALRFFEAAFSIGSNALCNLAGIDRYRRLTGVLPDSRSSRLFTGLSFVSLFLTVKLCWISGRQLCAIISLAPVDTPEFILARTITIPIFGVIIGGMDYTINILCIRTTLSTDTTATSRGEFAINTGGSSSMLSFGSSAAHMTDIDNGGGVGSGDGSVGDRNQFSRRQSKDGMLQPQSTLHRNDHNSRTTTTTNTTAPTNLIEGSFTTVSSAESSSFMTTSSDNPFATQQLEFELEMERRNRYFERRYSLRVRLLTLFSSILILDISAMAAAALALTIFSNIDTEIDALAIGISATHTCLSLYLLQLFKSGLERAAQTSQLTTTYRNYRNDRYLFGSGGVGGDNMIALERRDGGVNLRLSKAQESAVIKGPQQQPRRGTLNRHAKKGSAIAITIDDGNFSPRHVKKSSSNVIQSMGESDDKEEEDTGGGIRASGRNHSKKASLTLDSKQRGGLTSPKIHSPTRSR